MASRIRKGDTVIVLTGKSRGLSGEVLAVFPKEDRVLVKGANMCVRHVKPSVKNPDGGRILQENALHISNVAILDSESQMSTRIGFRIENGEKVRYSKRSGARIG